jgi:translation initiation factor IF-2
LTGVGCPATADASYLASYPAGTPVPTLPGGWTGNNCAGWFWSVPMSGSAATDDLGTFVLWYFNTGALPRGKCHIWVYVPQGNTPQEVAGNPTTYKVLRSRDDPQETGSFSIDQTANRAQWVDAGSFAFDGGHLAVKMVNRGSGAAGDRHAAAQLALGCTA